MDLDGIVKKYIIDKNIITKNRVIKVLIFVILATIIIFPIYKEIKSNDNFKEVKYKDINKIIDDTSSYGFAFLYVAPRNSKLFEENRIELKRIISKYKKDSGKINFYYLNSKKLTNKEMKKLNINQKTKTAYIFISNNEIIKSYNDTNDKELLKKYIKEYSGNGIDKSILKLVIPKDSKEYLKSIKSKKKTKMTIFGKSNCFYCKQYLPVINTVIEENETDDIYYLDSGTYNVEEYNKILNSGLIIPGKCTPNNKDIKLDKGFGTPLTIFTKGGKIVDCISGYVGKNNLINILNEKNIIKN